MTEDDKIRLFASPETDLAMLVNLIWGYMPTMDQFVDWCIKHGFYNKEGKILCVKYKNLSGKTLTREHIRKIWPLEP